MFCCLTLQALQGKIGHRPSLSFNDISEASFVFITRYVNAMPLEATPRLSIVIFTINKQYEHGGCAKL
jgi:hypothetical protein